MKQFKTAFLFLGMLSVFILTGCVGGSGGTQSSGLNQPSVKAPGGGNVTNDTGFTHFTIQSATGNTAGEIVGNNILVQMPYGTDESAPLRVLFTVPVGSTVSLSGSDAAIVSGETLFSAQSNIYTVTNGNSIQDYTVTLVTLPKTFQYFGQALQDCIYDNISGDVWQKNIPSTAKNWDDAMESDIAGLNSKVICGTVGGWNLPTTSQMKVMLNYVPLAYRNAPESSGSAANWFNQQGFNLVNGAYWGSDIDYRYFVNILELNSSANDINSIAWTTNQYTWAVYTKSASHKSITDFSLSLESGDQVVGTIEGNYILLQPKSSQINQLTAKVNFTTTGDKVMINGVPISNGDTVTLDFTQPIPVTVVSLDGNKNIYTVRVLNTPSINPQPIFSQFELFDSVTGQMAPGIIDNDTNTITVKLSDGANLYSKVNFSTLVPANITIESTQIEPGNMIRFDDVNGNNVPVVFTSTVASMVRSYTVKVQSNSTYSCNCTPFTGQNTCSCPSTPLEAIGASQSASHVLACVNNPNSNAVSFSYTQPAGGKVDCTAFHPTYHQNFQLGAKCVNGDQSQSGAFSIKTLCQQY